MGVRFAVKVDRTLCRGHGRCMALVPEAFEYDEDEDQSRPRADEELADVGLDRLKLAAQACPERAITVEPAR